MSNKLIFGGALCAMLALGHQARAVALESYEFQGQLGSETTLAPASVAAHLSGLNFGELNVTPSAGVNSINASGWTNPAAAYTFGFTIAAGYSASVNQLTLTSRSSGTGPGFLSVQEAVDGGSYMTIASIIQSGTNFNDEILSVTPVTGTTSLMFRIVTANQTAAGGATTGSSGTFRVGDDGSSSTPTPFTLGGTVVALAATSIPEPTSLLLLATGALGLLGVRRGLT